jgi:hypothetical protein
MVGQDDCVGERRRVDLVVVAVEGGQFPGLLGRGEPASCGRRDAQMDDDVERQPDTLQQRPGHEQHPAVRHRLGSGAHRPVPRQVPQGRQVPARAVPAQRVQHLARQRPGVEPVGVAGVRIGAAVLEPQ